MFSKGAGGGFETIFGGGCILSPLPSMVRQLKGVCQNCKVIVTAKNLEVIWTFWWPVTFKKIKGKQAK